MSQLQWREIATHQSPSTLEVRSDVLALRKAEIAHDIAERCLAVMDAQHTDLSTQYRKLLDMKIAAIQERDIARARGVALRADMASMEKRRSLVKKEVDAMKGRVSCSCD